MDATRHTLPQRVTAVLHAKQYLVFFAIGLYTLDFAVPLGSAWLYRRGPLAELLRQWGPLADAVAARSALIAAVFVAYLLRETWLRAGYIRSLVGPFHCVPPTAASFCGCSPSAGSWRSSARSPPAPSCSPATTRCRPTSSSLGSARLLLRRALRRLHHRASATWGRCGRSPFRGARCRPRFVPSALILLVVTCVGSSPRGLLDESVTGSLARALPMMLVQCVIMGGVIFVADVVLVVLYLNAAETGRLTPKPRKRGRRADSLVSPTPTRWCSAACSRCRRPRD